MKTALLVAAILAIVGGAICLGVAVNEIDYYASHPNRTGVSGLLIWLALGAALGCAAVAVVAFAVRRLVDRTTTPLLNWPTTRR